MIFKFEHFEVNDSEFQLTAYGQVITLEPKALRVLLVLLRNPNRLVRKQELLEAVWKDSFVTENAMTRTISLLRKVLGDDQREPRFIETVPTLGYRFKIPVETVLSPADNDSVLPSFSSASDSVPTDGPNSKQEPKATIGLSRAGSSEILKNPHLSLARRPLWLSGLVSFIIVALLVVAGMRIGRTNLRLRDIVAAPRIRSIAVIPLDNLSGDPSQEYFADGMTDELITMLAKNSTLRVTSRTSIMQYKGAHRPLPEIARELGVDGILEGTISRTADKVHMNIELIQLPRDTHVWAESYDRNASDVASLPREAAQTIAKRLDSAVAQASTARYVSPEAHDAYLHGMYLWFSSNSNEDCGKYFKKAIKLQPDFAAAWGGLANYYGRGAYAGDLDPRTTLGLEMAAARKAVELDDGLAEAHKALGIAYLLADWDWTRAEQELDRAIELDPRLAEAYSFRSSVQFVVNRPAEAIESAKKASELNPFESPSELTEAYRTARQYDQALKAALERVDSSAQDVSLHANLSMIYRAKGMLKEAFDEKVKLFEILGDTESVDGLRRSYQQGGFRATLVWRFHQNEKDAIKGYVSPMDNATIAAQLGWRDISLGYLEQAYQQHAPAVIFLQTDPSFDFLHADLQYRSLVKRIGLPPAY